MKLKDYFETHKVTPTEFAAMTRISVTSLYRYMKGKRPHLSVAIVIERATGGHVRVEDLRKVHKI